MKLLIFSILDIVSHDLDGEVSAEKITNPPISTCGKRENTAGKNTCFLRIKTKNFNLIRIKTSIKQVNTVLYRCFLFLTKKNKFKNLFLEFISRIFFKAYRKKFYKSKLKLS